MQNALMEAIKNRVENDLRWLEYLLDFYGIHSEDKDKISDITVYYLHILEAEARGRYDV